VDEDRGVIVGATFTGPEIAEFLHAATIAVVGEVPLERLFHAVPAFPTRSEVWLYLLEELGIAGPCGGPPRAGGGGGGRRAATWGLRSGGAGATSRDASQRAWPRDPPYGSGGGCGGTGLRDRGQRLSCGTYCRSGAPMASGLPLNRPLISANDSSEEVDRPA
jgi:hypothetical protein